MSQDFSLSGFPNSDDVCWPWESKHSDSLEFPTPPPMDKFGLTLDEIGIPLTEMHLGSPASFFEPIMEHYPDYLSIPTVSEHPIMSFGSQYSELGSPVSNFSFMGQHSFAEMKRIQTPESYVSNSPRHSPYMFPTSFEGDLAFNPRRKNRHSHSVSVQLNPETLRHHRTNSLGKFSQNAFPSPSHSRSDSRNLAMDRCLEDLNQSFLSQARSNSPMSPLVSPTRHKKRASVSFSEKNQKNEAEEYVCEHCEKTFTKLMLFNSHLVSHKGTKNFACDMCRQGFARNHDLLRHKRTVHKEGRPFKCDICLQTFESLSKIDNHTKRLHGSQSDIKPHSTPVPSEDHLSLFEMYQSNSTQGILSHEHHSELDRFMPF